VELPSPNHKNKLVTKILKMPRTWTDSLDKRPKRKKMDMRFGTWNIRSTYTAGSLKEVAKEISKHMLYLVGEGIFSNLLLGMRVYMQLVMIMKSE
jgi:hypothetical protein